LLGITSKDHDKTSQALDSFENDRLQELEGTIEDAIIALDHALGTKHQDTIVDK